MDSNLPNIVPPVLKAPGLPNQDNVTAPVIVTEIPVADSLNPLIENLPPVTPEPSTLAGSEPNIQTEAVQIPVINKPDKFEVPPEQIHVVMSPAPDDLLAAPVVSTEPQVAQPTKAYIDVYNREVFTTGEFSDYSDKLYPPDQV